MNLAGRLILLILAIDTFLYFGMGAVGESGYSFGNDMSRLVTMNGNINSTYGAGLVNVSSSSFIPASTQSLWSFSAIVNSIWGFVQMLFGMATAPFTFLSCNGGICAPLFMQVLVGGTYMMMAIIAVVQLISGRSA